MPRQRSPTRHPTPHRLWLYGHHAVAAALANRRRRCARLVLATSMERERALCLTELAKKTDPPCAVEYAETRRIKSFLTPDATHQGAALNVAPLPSTHLDRFAENGARTLAILDGVTDPRNVGAILRSAAAFGVGGLVLTTRRAPPESGALAKAASGALEHVAIARVVNLAMALAALKEAGFTCAGLDAASASSFNGFTPTPRTALVLGAEGRGLRRLTRSLCHCLLRIEQENPPGLNVSLNVSNAAAVAFHGLYIRRKSAS